MFGLLLKFLPIVRSPYSIIALIALAVGGWGGYKVHGLFHVSQEDILRKQIEQMEEAHALAIEQKERESATRSVREKYVEKPMYRECKPDIGWVRDFNALVSGTE